jgi:hypothetical protein
LHCKLELQLNWAPVRSIFCAAGKSIMEIPAKIEEKHEPSITLLSSVGPRCMNVSETGSISVI